MKRRACGASLVLLQKLSRTFSSFSFFPITESLNSFLPGSSGACRTLFEALIHLIYNLQLLLHAQHAAEDGGLVRLADPEKSALRHLVSSHPKIAAVSIMGKN